MMGQTIGLHASLYVSAELLAAAQQQAAALPVRLVVDPHLTALEILGLLLLQQTGRLQR